MHQGHPAKAAGLVKGVAPLVGGVQEAVQATDGWGQAGEQRVQQGGGRVLPRLAIGQDKGAAQPAAAHFLVQLAAQGAHQAIRVVSQHEAQLAVAVQAGNLLVDGLLRLAGLAVDALCFRVPVLPGDERRQGRQVALLRQAQGQLVHGLPSYFAR